MIGCYTKKNKKVANISQLFNFIDIIIFFGIFKKILKQEKMKEPINNTSLVQRALTTRTYSRYTGKGPDNTFIIAPGADLLHDALKEHAKKNFKFPLAVLGKTLCDDNLISVLKIIKEKYDLKIKDAPPVFYRNAKKNPPSIKRIDSELIKALAYATFMNHKEVFFVIVEELKNMMSVQNDPVYKMREIMAQSEAGFFEPYFILQLLSCKGNNVNSYKGVLDYGNYNVEATGFSKKEILEIVCRKWLERHKISY